MSDERESRRRLSKKVTLLSKELPVEILIWLQTNGPASAAEIAEGLQVPPSKVRYQLRQLGEMRIIELVEEKRRRGVVERYYLSGEERAAIMEDSELAELPAEQRDRLLAQILKQSFGSLLGSLKAGLLVRRQESVVAHVPLRLDRQGWAELVRIHRERSGNGGRCGRGRRDDFLRVFR